MRMGEGETLEQAIAIMMESHWRSAVHPDRIEGIAAFNEGRDPAFQDSDYWQGTRIGRSSTLDRQGS